MTKHDGNLTKAFLFFVLILLAGIAATVFVQQKTVQPARAVNVEVKITPPPVHSSAAPSITQSEVHSAKGAKKLILRASTRADGTTEYAFFTTDIDGGNERLLYSKILNPGAEMSIPFNAWDPTDTYVFLEERVAGVPNYYVFRVDGAAIANGEQFINVGAVWIAKSPGYAIRTATGWASGTLLIIYTSKDDGTRGPAFWFEIPDTAILQLAS